LLLSKVSSVSGDPGAARQSCQDGRAPQSTGCSGSGVVEDFSAYGLVNNHNNHKKNEMFVPHLCRNK
jgi:hypothetical protein